jgi:hypothetical protein
VATFKRGKYILSAKSTVEKVGYAAGSYSYPSLVGSYGTAGRWYTRGNKPVLLQPISILQYTIGNLA